MNLEEAQNEIARLKNAIKTHRDARGDDRCWIDDLDLYKALGEDEVPKEAQLSLPVLPAFMSRCAKYWEQRQAPKNEPWVTVEELVNVMTEVKKLADTMAYVTSQEALEDHELYIPGINENALLMSSKLNSVLCKFNR